MELLHTWQMKSEENVFGEEAFVFSMTLLYADICAGAKLKYDCE